MDGEGKTELKKDEPQNRGSEPAPSEENTLPDSSPGAPSKGGKRLCVPEKKTGHGRLGFVILLIFAILAAFYILLCAIVGSSKLMPHTVVSDVDVGNMQPSEADALLSRTLKGRLDTAAVQFSFRDCVYSVSGTEFTLPGELTEPIRKEQSDFFLKRGFSYLMSSLHTDRRDIPVKLNNLPDICEKAYRETLIPGDLRGSWSPRPTEGVLLVTKGSTRREMDIGSLLPLLEERMCRTVNDPDSGEETVTAPGKDTPPAEPDWEVIARIVQRDVRDARFDPETKEIIPSVAGVRLDTAQASEMYEKAEEAAVLPVPLAVTEPSVKTEDLSSVLFRDILGEAETYVTGSSDRRHNVRIAASLMDDSVVLPGEEFSFSKTTSPYTVANGYGKATAYIGGLSKETVAGGICQASSTLYWATLRADLKIGERHAHRYEPAYITGGLDATIYGDFGDENALDFTFTNDTAYPLRISSETKMKGTKQYLHVTIKGTDETGIHGEPYSAHRVVTVPAITLYEANEAIPAGTTKKDPERTAYNGVGIDTYQKLVDKDGKTVSETMLYHTKYAARNAVIWYNPADAVAMGIDTATGIRTEPVEAEPTEVSPQTSEPDVTESPALPTEGETLLPPEAAEESPLPEVFTEPTESEIVLPPPEGENTSAVSNEYPG